MEIKTKRLRVKINCLAQYFGYIDVPEDLDLEDAIGYAESEIDNIPLGDLQWVGDDGIDEDCCEFE